MLAMLPHCSPLAVASLLLALCLSLVTSQFAAAQQISLPGCPSTCGNLTIPYPFGIGTNCAREGFDLNCNDSSTPPKTYLLNTSYFELRNISLAEGQAKVQLFVGTDCYNSEGKSVQSLTSWANFRGNLPYSYSNTRNKFTVIGCDTYAFIQSHNFNEFASGCISVCDRLDKIVNGSCAGIGCCQTTIPKGLKHYEIPVKSFSNHTKVWVFNPCSYAFLVDQDWFTFKVEDVTGSSIYRSPEIRVPVVLDWVAGKESCAVAAIDKNSYACRSENSECYDSTASGAGYLCKCKSGYEGNPYIAGGCQDIDECQRKESYPCGGVCTNIPGGYICECPKGKYGNATSYDCRDRISYVNAVLATIFPALFVTTLAICFYGFFEKRKRDKLAQKLYEQNGGTILESHLSTHRDIQSRFKIFTKEELEKATNNFDDQLVVGRGGQGKVYKGTLFDGTRIAIKKSVELNDAKDDGFINEIILLSKIYHPNVVKLLGCCLEVDIPYLVYEFVPNKTLFDHIHRPGLTWKKRLSIAVGAAKALAHLHSIGIYHQDVKSMNILLTVDYIAKISDFGLSRLAPTDAKALSTLVQGTVGYLDPEFIVTHKLTDKSDVFSFGVVLAELLTGKKPLCYERCERERSLAQYFHLVMEENNLDDILDQQIAVGATDVARLQMIEVATLANECLNMKGKDRPDMLDVFQRINKLWKSEDRQSVEDENAEVMNSLLDSQGLESRDDEGEECKILFSSDRSHRIAAFDIKAGR